MTSSSRGAELAFVLMLSGGAATACVQERVIETQALIVALNCEDLPDPPDNTVNTYRVMLFEMPPGASDSSMCRPACMLDGTCPLQEMVCACGRDQVPETFGLNRE